MDLKEFIKETVSGIVNASKELTEEGLGGAILNPPTDLHSSSIYEEDGVEFVYRRVGNIEFDVAVTVEDDSHKEGKAGLRVFSSELGGGASKGNRNEVVSRVRFSMSITFPRTNEELMNRYQADEAKKQQSEALKQRPRSGGFAGE